MLLSSKYRTCQCILFMIQFYTMSYVNRLCSRYGWANNLIEGPMDPEVILKNRIRSARSLYQSIKTLPVSSEDPKK